jgi:DnaD/phage-associated family protein
VTARSRQKFKGFPPGRVHFTSLPEPFFTELLDQVDSLNELKVILYAFWALGKLEGNVRYLKYTEMLADQGLLDSLDPGDGTSADALEGALQAAVKRNVLLILDPDPDGERFYFLNTQKSRAVVQAFQSGSWKPGQEAYLPVRLDLVKPNLFQLYEQNIGPLTPMIADMLKLAEQEYPTEWFEDAFRIAVANNIRKWKYIEAVLKSWQERGKDDENRRDAQTNYHRYIEGEFARYIEH